MSALDDLAVRGLAVSLISPGEGSGELLFGVCLEGFGQVRITKANIKY